MPRRVGHYQILERVYQTRWEDLYHATDNRSGKPVSLKIIASTLPAREQQRLFTNERDALKNLKHPNIVQFLDAAGEAGHFHIAVEPLNGTTASTASLVVPSASGSLKSTTANPAVPPAR